MTSTSTFLRSTLIMLAIGIVLLASIVVSLLWLVQKNSLYSEETADLRRIRAAAVDLLTAVQDAETGQRGYLLTNDPKYLVPYNEAVASLPERRKRLKDSIATRPAYAVRFNDLDPAIDSKMAELKRTVDLMQANRATEAFALVGTDDGLVQMRNVREILNNSLMSIDSRLRIIVQDQLNAASTLRWTTIGGAIAIVLVIGGAVFIIFQHVRDLSQARREVEELNIGLENRVNERTQDLIRANEEIQRFAYIVTHDLRAPLVNIMGFLSELETSLKALDAYVLADDKPPSEQEIREARLAVQEDLPEAVGFIRSSTRKMDALINAILKISREGKRKLVPEKVELQSLIESAAASVHHQVTQSEGTVDITTRVRNIVTDRFSLDQVIGNLLDNAIKYHASNRPIMLKIDVLPEGRGFVRIDIKDNGRGIAKQDQERIFELFRRAGEQNQSGEGIGLAYVRSLTRNLGGDVTVESELGVGSTFTVRLPADLSKVLRSTDL